MGNLIFSGEKFQEYAFEDEKDFESAVIENCKFLFGKDSIYIDVKRRLGDSYNRGIPDGYVIDFSNINTPQLYFVENELESHDIYSHISEQIARFGSIIATSKSSIRDMLIKEIEKNTSLNKTILEKLKDTRFENIHDFLIYLVEKTKIKIAVVIDNITDDLILVLDNFKNTPDVLMLQRYIKGDKISYYCEPLLEEIQEDVSKKSRDEKEFDTVVCAAFEEGFQSAYVNSNAWWAIRLSQKAREKLKYLAIYEKSPIGAVRNFAEIERIEPYEDSGKFIVYLKNKKPIDPIKFDKAGSAPQSPRFTTYDKLTKAKTLSELWE